MLKRNQPYVHQCIWWLCLLQQKMAYCVGFVNVAKIFSTGTTIKRTVDCGKCQWFIVVSMTETKETIMN